MKWHLAYVLCFKRSSQGCTSSHEESREVAYPVVVPTVYSVPRPLVCSVPSLATALNQTEFESRRALEDRSLWRWMLTASTTMDGHTAAICGKTGARIRQSCWFLVNPVTVGHTYSTWTVERWVAFGRDVRVCQHKHLRNNSKLVAVLLRNFQ